MFTLHGPIRRLVVPPVGPISISAGLLVNISRAEPTGGRGEGNIAARCLASHSTTALVFFSQFDTVSIMQV